MGKKAGTSSEMRLLNARSRADWKKFPARMHLNRKKLQKSGVAITRDSSRNINKRTIVGPLGSQHADYPDAGPLGKTDDPEFNKAAHAQKATKVSEAAKERLRAKLKLKSKKKAAKKKAAKKK